MYIYMYTSVPVLHRKPCFNDVVLRIRLWQKQIGEKWQYGEQVESKRRAKNVFWPL